MYVCMIFYLSVLKLGNRMVCSPYDMFMSHYSLCVVFPVSAVNLLGESGRPRLKVHTMNFVHTSSFYLPYNLLMTSTIFHFRVS